MVSSKIEISSVLTITRSGLSVVEDVLGGRVAGGEVPERSA